MKTYSDLQEAIKNGYLNEFLLSAIVDYKSSDLYKTAEIAYKYMCKRNVTINNYRKLLYTLSGSAVPDNYSANYKLNNAFFPILVNQENEFLLGNGVTFNDDATKEALGGEMFDNQLKKAGRAALWGGVSFGFFNTDHIDVFNALEFVPIWDDESGALRAGIRFWQIDRTKPLRMTFYELDGYTEYIRRDADVEIYADKRSYQLETRISEVSGIEIIDGKNYPGFPIVPLWANNEHQSEFCGLREKIDCYDLIQSGFANDLDDASQIYWTITNAGGMEDIDLVKFVERMKTVRAAVVDENGSNAEAHTLNVPYEARMQALSNIRDSLYRDAMALDTDKISAGNITATAIEASYENLNLKSAAYEECLTDFISAILKIAEIEDSPTYKPNRIINMAEDTQMILSAAQYLDDETILKHLPFISPDEIPDIIKRKLGEEYSRYLMEMEEGAMNNGGQSEGMDGQTTEPNDGQAE